MEIHRTESTIQPPGLAVAWISSALVVIGLIALSSGTILVGLLGLIFLGICRFLSKWHLEGVEVSRPLPARVFSGRSFPVEAILTNKHDRSSAVDFRIDDPLASSRLYRKFTVHPGRRIDIRYPGKCLRRGLIRPGGWTVTSSYPLGLYRSTRRGIFTESSSILAIPRPYLHERLQRHIDSRLLGGSQFLQPLPDSADEFRLLREFRSGDPIRSIHWPSSLRASQLQVRQTDPPTPKPPRTCLVVHSFTPPGRMATPETFELILRIAAGLLVRFRDSDTEVDFHIIPDGPLRLRRTPDFDAAFETLALLERKPIKNLSVKLSAIERLSDTYILGDSPIDGWESEVRSLFPNGICIDTAGLTTRPLFSTPLRRLAS